MRRLVTRISAAALLALAGCHTCDVCDDCGDGNGCGSSSYHARHYGDPGFAPGYVAPPIEGTVSKSTKRVPMQTLPTTPKLVRTPAVDGPSIVR
jgi:hypothetical protein